MIHVVNRSDPNFDPDTRYSRVVNIMRPNVLGNPYPTIIHGREEAVRLFRRHMWEMWRHGNNEMAFTLEALILEEGRFPDKNLYLVCCCKPKDCHGDKIKNFIEYMKTKRSDSIMWGRG